LNKTSPPPFTWTSMNPGASHALSGKVRIGIGAGNSRLAAMPQMRWPSITTAQSWCKAVPSKTVLANTACRFDPLIWSE
jgi:hypothetical protein